jgi:sugar lactone lactonase YvrE
MHFSTSVAGIPGGGPIAIDGSCRIWVADTGNDRFAIFDQRGGFIEYWGSSGESEGQFNLREPLDNGYGTVAFAPSGEFYVLDTGNHRVQHFDKARKFLGSWSGSGTDAGRYDLPLGLAVNAEGVVYVLDSGRNVVEAYDKDGKVLTSFSPRLAGPYTANGLQLDGQGNIYVVAAWQAGNGIRKFDSKGTLLATIGSFGLSIDPQMTGVAVDAAGRVFALQSGPAGTGHSVRVYDRDGTFVASFGDYGSGDGQVGRGWAFGIALDGEGNVYLTSPGKNRLEKFRLLPPLAP